MRLSISDDMFTHANEKVPGGHLIWVDECPSVLISFELDKGYRAICRLADNGHAVFFGQALVKRRQRHGRDLLIFLLPDVDVGHLSPEATIELNRCGLELE